MTPSAYVVLKANAGRRRRRGRWRPLGELDRPPGRVKVLEVPADDGFHLPQGVARPVGGAGRLVVDEPVEDGRLQGLKPIGPGHGNSEAGQVISSSTA